MRTEANGSKIIAAIAEPKQAVQLNLPAEYCIKYRQRYRLENLRNKTIARAHTHTHTHTQTIA